MGTSQNQALKQLLLSQKAANAQLATNMVEQVDQYGNKLTYSINPNIPVGQPGHYIQTQTLSPIQQQLQDQENQQNLAENAVASKALTSASGVLGNKFALGKVTPQNISLDKTLDYGGPADLSGKADQRALSYYDQYIMPRAQQDRASLEQKLYNQGIVPGMEAYDREFRNFNDQVAKDRQGFMLQAQNQGFDQALQARQNDTGEANAIFGNQNQAIQAEAGANNTAQLNATNANNQATTSEYTVPVNTYSALTEGAQVTNPSYQTAPQAQIGAPDYLGAKQAANASADAKQAALYGAIGSGVGAVGQAVMMKSDRRLKTDIKKKGKLFGGVNSYEYRMKGSPFMQLGVMADEVEKTMPEAVITGADGYKMVNYGKIAQRLQQAGVRA